MSEAVDTLRGLNNGVQKQCVADTAGKAWGEYPFRESLFFPNNFLWPIQLII